MRRKIAAGNWKMNTTPSEGVEFIRSLAMKDIPDDVDVILGVPFTHLSILNQISNDEVIIASQNVSEQESGAYTGEISTAMLKDLLINYVIIGHSERREIYGEGDDIIQAKVKRAIADGMNVIFCCGEPLDIRKADKQNEYVSSQIRHGLFDLSAEELKRVVIAYEPIWAIGTGETATPEQAEIMHAYIRYFIAEKYGVHAAAELSILYGGSVKPGNAKELFSMPDVDGGLVGGASLKVDSFVEIIQSF